MSDKKEIKFAEKLSMLEEIVSQIESGDLSLEDSLALFEEGKKLIKDLNLTLESAKEKISEYQTIESK